MKMKLILLAMLLIFLPSFSHAQGLTLEEQVYDFGHIGIDFQVMHELVFVNRTDVAITLSDLHVSCDCSTVRSNDSIVQPGDTALFALTFETKDYYGPVNKSFTVQTDHPKLPELKYFYLSIVGQWFNGIKPSPISLFFLPSKKSQVVSIPNKQFEKIELTSFAGNNSIVEVKLLKSTASINESIEIEVSPKKDLKNGTLKTSITLHVSNDDNEEVILTIPIKIVKY